MSKTIPMLLPDDIMQQAKTLSEALPYLRQHAGKIFVIKYGGNAMDGGEGSAMFARDIALLSQVGILPVIVHGGGPQIDQMLARSGIASQFVDGLRVTSAEAINVIEMVLSGSVNKELVSTLQQEGATAIGLSGKDGRLLLCEKYKHPKTDYGYVGTIKAVNTNLIQALLTEKIIPVIAPIGVGARGETYNINADTVAGAVAAALGASRFYLLTNVPGVLDKDGNLISEMDVTEAKSLMTDGTITGGMIPKIQTCLDAAEGGANCSVILDGRVPHALLLEVFTPQGLGTLVKASA